MPVEDLSAYVDFLEAQIREYRAALLMTTRNEELSPDDASRIHVLLYG